MRSASVSVVGSQQNFVGVLSRKRRHLLRVLSQTSPLEKYLLVACGILVLICLALLIALAVTAGHRKVREVTAVCNTKECIRAASMLLDSMDRTVNPCDDFYQFACGNWASSRVLPDDSFSSWFSERTRYVQRQILEILTENDTSKDPTSLKQARSLYRSCMDTETLDTLGLEPMFEVLDSLSLPRNIPSSETAASFRLARTLALAQRVLSSDILIQLSTTVDPVNNLTTFLIAPSYSIPSLPEIMTPEPRHAEINGRKLFVVKLTYMTNVLAEISSEENTTALATSALRILVTDAQITSDIKDSETDEPPLRTTFEKIQELMDSTNGSDKSPLRFMWDEYLDVLFNGTQRPLNMTSPVIVQSPAYLQALAARLAKSKPESIQRLIWWKIVDSLSPHTTTTLRRIRDNFMQTLYGGNVKVSRPNRCGNIVKSFYTMAVSYKMASEDNMNATAKKVRSMLKDINQAFQNMVKSVPWMDEKTKQATLGKAKAISDYIGYPDWLLQPGELENLYEGYEVKENQFLKSMLSIKAVEVMEIVSQIGKEPEDDDPKYRWMNDPTEVNAYYSRTINAISIPAGILQIPFYYLGLDYKARTLFLTLKMFIRTCRTFAADRWCMIENGNRALNYGAIGSILGHELTHGFDIEGKEYDASGERVSWWDNHMTQVYNQKAECFVRQYSNYSLGDDGEELQINGSLTLAENIADNGGIREAVLGYRMYTQRNGPELPLPGFEKFTHEQLLFMAFANVWCESSTAEHDVISLGDVHSPNRYRVLGSLSNSPEFASIYKCPKGSKMNPDHKCILW